VILLDTSGLLAAIDSSQRLHGACAAFLRASRGPRLLSPFVLAEIDYLLGTRVGEVAQRALLAEVTRGVYQLEPFDAEDVAKAMDVTDRYSGLALGLADASIVVLAERHRIRDVLTLDERHFRAVRRLDGKAFRILPSDSGPP
jgi:uncharacterized protein